MPTRRSFMQTAAIGGIAGIAASQTAPAFAQEMKMLKIGQLGLGSHSFAARFKNPPAQYRDIIKCIPYIVWDDIPGVAEKMKTRFGFEKTAQTPVELVKECDVVHIEHADYRKVCELARPALEAGKPVFINRPFTASVADAEEIVRLARKHEAPLMQGSSLEYQPILQVIARFAKEKGPVRAYECYCPEPFFPWMFPHVLNFAHAALGGGIESAYFSGDFVMEWGDFKVVTDSAGANPKFLDPKRPYGAAVSLLTYKSRENQPPIIGMNHIGGSPGSYHLTVYAQEESKQFVAGDHLNAPNIFEPMFLTLNDFYVNRKPPRPYEAILEQHRALVATNVSRLTGKAAKLASLKPSDAVPYTDNIRNYLLRSYR
jgi:predicted dehydrogenase